MAELVAANQQLSFAQQPMVQNVLPFVTSVAVHLGIVIIAWVLWDNRGVIQRVIEEQIIVPDAAIVEGADVGGIPNPGLGGDPTRAAAQDITADTTASDSWADRKSETLQANLMGGFGDCNTDFDGRNLCTDGAQWIRDNRDLIVQMYGNYAQMVHRTRPGKQVIWWLEGDFIQYSYDDQSNPLSYAELGALARDITCAIKSNQPTAVVAMNHSPWISDEQADGFWSAQPMDVLDLVWCRVPETPTRS